MADGAGDLLAIANRFAVTGVPSRIEAHNGGHINDTWFVSTDLDRRYVLQRINPLVFPDAIGVVGNTGRVIAEIERRTVGLVPPFVAARDGSTAVVIGDSVYRMLGFVTGRGLDGLESVGQAAAAGLAFGRFQRALVHYDRSDHVIPIPRFHEVAFQLERFDQALDRPQPDRAKDASNDIARAQRARKRVIAESLGPYGMIHGDGKVTNLLFDEQDRVVAVLDLDTVMWGALAWDFGDLVRSAAAVGAEDARDIGFSIERFRALAGWLHARHRRPGDGRVARSAWLGTGVYGIHAGFALSDRLPRRRQIFSRGAPTAQPAARAQSVSSVRSDGRCAR